MARPKKTEADGDNLFSLKTSELLWMRDKFISGLSNLESGVHELRRAYISHFNTLLPDGHPGRLSLPFFTSFDNNAAGVLGNVPAEGTPVAAPGGAAAIAAATAAANADADKKRKRKAHDPNAPKRALTSYFLFMQHNKPAIKELNPSWDAKQVAEESERRWNNISETDKQRYEYMYQVDLARYYRQKEAYEAGEPIPEIDADEAQRLYNEHLSTGQPFKGRKGRKVDGIQPPADMAPPVAATSAQAEEEDSEEEEEEAPAPPPKSKRAKKESTAPASATKASAKKSFKEIVPSKSPEVPKKKGGRKSKAAEETPAAEEPVAASPKKEKKTGGRKRKSTAAE